MNKNLKLKIVSYISHLTALVCFYNILTITTPNFILSRQDNKANNSLNFENQFSNHNSIVSPVIQKALIKKIYLDYKYQQITDHYKKNIINTISINKEGKIIGYKSNQLRSISYKQEKKIIHLISKNILVMKAKKSIYWLYIYRANKY